MKTKCHKTVSTVLGAGIGLILCGLSVAPALAQGASGEQGIGEKIIRQDTSVGGIQVGGLTVDQATQVIQSAFKKPLTQQIVVKVDGKPFYLSVARLKPTLKADLSAKRAYYEAKDAKPSARVKVKPALTFSRAAAVEFANKVSAKVSVAVLDAKMQVGMAKITRTKSRVGRGFDSGALASKIEAAMLDATASRLIEGKTTVVKPKVTWHDLENLNPTIVTIDKRTFTLRIFKKLALKRTFKVAIGQPGYPTPSGTFRIQNKAIDPVWSAPDKPWAGALRGEKIAGGAANNPLKARWLGITDGVGIHGTSATGSIGSRASHGCIRMTVPDVKAVYQMVPVGALVVIAG